MRHTFQTSDLAPGALCSCNGNTWGTVLPPRLVWAWGFSRAGWGWGVAHRIWMIRSCRQYSGSLMYKDIQNLLVLTPGTFWKDWCFIATFWSKCALCYFCKSLGFSRKDLTEAKSWSAHFSSGTNMDRISCNPWETFQECPYIFHVYLYHTHKWILFCTCTNIKADIYSGFFF